MKGLAFRKLSRTSSHRRALLRNLVTSLIQHERISTTVAKAKEAQREANKIISKAKRGLLQGRVQQDIKARDYLFSRDVTAPKLKELAERYKERPGGFTRLHLHGARKGDNAPRAVLELVDSTQGDLKMELVARTLARESLLRTRRLGEKAVAEEIGTFGTRALEDDERLRPLTRLNVKKLVRYGGTEARERLATKAQEHYFRLLATESADGPYGVDEERVKAIGHNGARGESQARPMLYRGAKRWAGMQKDPGMGGPEEPRRLRPDRPNSVIRIGKGAFAKRQDRRTRVLMPVLAASSRPDQSSSSVASNDSSSSSPVSEAKWD